MTMTPTWVSVGTFPHGYLAELAAATLRSQNVEVMVRGNDVGLFGAGFHGWSARGWEVLVPSPHAEFAREVLSADDPEDDPEDEADDDAAPDGEK
jgi:hypothetical protein